MKRAWSKLRMLAAEYVLWVVLWLVPKGHPDGQDLLRHLSAYAGLVRTRRMLAAYRAGKTGGDSA